MSTRPFTRHGAVRCAPLLLALVLSACANQSGDELRAQARDLAAKGDYKGAVITLKNATESDPHNAATRYLLARTYIETGDSLPAEKEARLAVREGYARAPAVAVLGRALILQGEFRKALELTADQAYEKDVLPVRADAFLALGERGKARDMFTQALRIDPGSAEAQIGLGRIAYLDGDVAAAHAHAARVLKAQPRSAEALMFEADLLRAEKRHDEAFATYDKVVAIVPQHRSAHIEKAYMAVGLGRYDLAQAELNAASRLAPGSVLVVYTQALLDYSRGRPEAARDSLHKVLRAAPEHMPSVLLAGAVSLKLGSDYLAEHHLRHYLEVHPDNVAARKMLATALLGTGHGQQAMGVLEPALKASGKDVELLSIAGQTHLQAGRFERAVDLFGQASALDPSSAGLRTSLGLSRLGQGDNTQAVRELLAATELDRGSAEAAVALIRTELQLEHLDGALRAAEALQRVQPSNAVAWELLGRAHAARREWAPARAAFQRALALAPSHYPAAAGLAQLALRDGASKEDGKRGAEAARRELLDFLEHNPRSVDAMTALSTLAAGQRQEQDATRWLQRAAALDPAAVGPAVNLIAQYLRTSQPEPALNLARTLQVANPENADLLDLLGKSQLANGLIKEALRSYKSLQAALPRSAQVLMQVAALQLLLGNPGQAEADLKGVLAMQPDFPSAQVELAEIHVRKGQPDLALIIAERMQRQHPRGAAGFQLQGDVLMAKRQPAEALAAYERAYALNPGSELVIKSDNALRQAGRADEAGQRLERWLAAHPDDLRALAYRAQTWMAAREFRRAAGQLEAVLARQPRNVVVRNNLALAYQELGDARALATAEAALKDAGEQADVMDTLAWILVGQGDTGRALPLLYKARALSPKARDIRFHLAAALDKAGEKAAARKELESLATGDMRFAQADDARKLLERLR
ncbi:PEP-CTERM system TPR-repeat protein PrsT [Massilia forsythiae]|uniref:PEP-CTERM system TPR-repeat protein PrsT n=1 Tax=Massilia forsythiae TaxID=2728020 RepID=A0A7Z2VZL2_9BURK|nr:XrtA/PEP-CTERM system TPR-repeat protein PrsT [Massilia forsythiae]QJE02134.1 PEP-CTERM system TPR-repeat protein PrsT [Massilia forsythiae]